jgi:hypothetical protein
MLLRFLVLVSCFVPFLGSCSWQTNKRPSIIVILVENLGFNAFSCHEGVEPGRVSGFQVFCDEGVRFTHAYTPSLMSQATIASILTAKYPHEHGVRHNGAQALSAREVTVAEAALQRGYSTAFFSGGPPVWRRNGLSQGFEVFDDNILVSQKRLYRSSTDVVMSFLNWLINDSAGGRFLAFLSFSDLQFIDAPTVNEFGEIRESSYQSQVEEVDEALGILISELKDKKLWNSSDIFLVGLDSSLAEARSAEAPLMNLFSESTRTTLMIKPARKPKDEVQGVKVDANVSLVDVGVTLFDLLGVKLPKSTLPSAEALNPVTLRSVMTSGEPDWDEDRLVLSESGWAQWRGLGAIRAAIRQGLYLYLFDERDRLFNTLTDSAEILPLPRGEDPVTVERWRFRRLLDDLGYRPWVPLSPEILEKLSLGRDLWRDRSPDLDTTNRLINLSAQNPENAIYRGWRAVLAIRQGDWKELKDAGQGKAFQNPVWSYVASRNMGEKVPVPDEPCLSFLKEGSHGSVTKTCSEEMIKDLLIWMDSKSPETERTRAMESFLRTYSAKALAARIAEHNQVAGLAWDTTSRMEGPEMIDLIISLPEMRKARPFIRSRMAADRR